MKKNKVLIQAWKDYHPEIVKINEEKIKNLYFSEENKAVLAENEIEALKDKSLEKAVRFLIGLNSINYQFWDLLDGEFVRYQNRGEIGALALFSGFTNLFQEIQEYNFDTNKINEEMMIKHFGDIPDKNNRIILLKESLNSINFQRVYEAIELHIQNDKMNVDLAEKIANILPKSYNEPYLKKIQLALYEISNVYQSRGKKVECDITVAADYQLPKVLEGMGILKYSEQLSKKIDNYELLVVQQMDLYEQVKFFLLN
jgi:hypothetical protein